MQDTNQNLLTRDDTLLGVCEGLGEDLGFNPLFLRLGLTVTLFFFPVYTILGYLAAGALVAITRWIAPAPRAALPAKHTQSAPAYEPLAEEMKIAA